MLLIVTVMTTFNDTTPSPGHYVSNGTEDCGGEEEDCCGEEEDCGGDKGDVELVEEEEVVVVMVMVAEEEIIAEIVEIFEELEQAEDAEILWKETAEEIAAETVAEEECRSRRRIRSPTGRPAGARASRWCGLRDGPCPGLVSTNLQVGRCLC